MQLIFLRHGIAIDRDDPDAPESDFDRFLTPEGKTKMIEAARGMRRLQIEFDHLVTSPLVRARETAVLVAEAYDPVPSIEILDELEPGMDPDVLLPELASRFSPDATVVLVGHEPDFSAAVSRLAFDAVGETFSLKKGGMACVEVDPTARRPRGKLLWLLTPQLLRAAGGAV